MSAIKERTDGPRIEFGQIQGLQGAGHQFDFELEHANQVHAFGAELLQGFPSPDALPRAVVVFDSSESGVGLEVDHEQLDLKMNSHPNVVHDSVWPHSTNHRKRGYLPNARVSRRRSRYPF